MQTNIFISLGVLDPAVAALIERITKQPDLVMGEAMTLSTLEPCLPSLPKSEPTERYAGVVLDESGKPTHHLFLLNANPGKKLKWKDAMEWADGLGASLPTKQEAALLYANLKNQFEASWYWTSTQFSEGGAWSQGFYGGGQYDLGKSSEGLVRAVRRLEI